jgi:predicted ATP-grasp superfamily ATP-dependent carboligase
VPRVLVTDAGRGSAIAIIRSLGRAGWKVTAADSDAKSPGFASRHVDGCVIYPNPAVAPDRAVEVLLAAAHDQGVNLIMPVTDDVILPLVDVRDRFERVCRVALPDSRALDVATNKDATLELARTLDIPVPRTEIVADAIDARRAAERIGWPVVLKPQVSRAYRPAQGTTALEVAYAMGPDELADRTAAMSAHTAVLVQEYCAGEGHGIELLVHCGRVLAAFQHRRIREVPFSGGPSSLRESAALDQALLDHSQRLVGALAWTGLVMVEFKLTPKGPRLMEVNGRVWGSLPLAVKSGMDFPAMAARMHLEGPPSPETQPAMDYRVGVRSRNVELELRWIASVLLRRFKTSPVPPPTRRQGLAAAFRLLHPGDGYDIAARDDPGPGRRDLARILEKAWRKGGLSGRERKQGRGR